MILRVVQLNGPPYDFGGANFEVDELGRLTIYSERHEWLATWAAGQWVHVRDKDKAA